MGAHRKRQGKPNAKVLLERSRRELAKGNAKQALKDAKLCYRGDTSPECRQLLEEAYLGRVEQLRAMRQFDDARAVLGELIAIKPTVPVVCQQIPRLQAFLGEGGEVSARLLEADPALSLQLADDAVLDSRCVLPPQVKVRPQVEQVRQALAAVEQGDDETASQLVSAIPRSSPMSDWKLFVRGLSAFYQRDDDRVQENWRRLDPLRPAWRIAQTLLAATDQPLAVDVPIDVTPALRRLERSLQSDPAADWLQRLSTHWQKSNWQQFFREYRNSIRRFAVSHARLVDSIVDLSWKLAVREGDWELLHEITRCEPAPPLDPHWHRAQAMIAEQHGSHEVSPVVDHWTAYANEMATLAPLQETERPIAAGLVHLHLARQFVGYAKDNESLNLYRTVGDDHVEQFCREAARSYRKAIEYSVQLTEAFHELARLHGKLEEPAKGAAVLERLVRVKPEDYEARVWLAHYYLGQDEPDKSEPHVREVLRLKPRDAQTAILKWNHRLTKIRCLVKKRQFDAARAEVDEAATHVPSDADPYLLDVLRAGIEIKAKNEPAARQHLDSALGKADEPTAVFAQLSCMSARYGLPREVKKEFDNKFKEAIKRSPTSATAGRLARFFYMLKATQIQYTGRATQERLLLKYLQRAKRLSWQDRDLEAVCAFLAAWPREKPLRDRLLKHGVESFPDSAMLQLLAGELEMESGPLFCNYREARHHMERALELVRMPGQSRDETVAERAQRALAMLGDSRPMFAPGRTFGDEDDDDPSDEMESWDESSEEDAEVSRFGKGMSPQQVVAELERIMPPEIAGIFEYTAQSIGMSSQDLIMEVLEQSEPFRQASQSARQRSSRRTKQRRKR